jgi:hypothetical protein
MIAVMGFSTFFKVYSLFEIERLSAIIYLILYKALIGLLMSDASPLATCCRYPAFEIAAPAKRVCPHSW